MSEDLKSLEKKYLKEEKNIKPKHKNKLQGLDNLSLGISIVVAILIGVGIGILLKNLTGYNWFLFIGIFWGVYAAFLNIYRAYKRAKKDYEDMENDPRYSYRAKYGDSKYLDDEDD
jgi:ATP synthase protein I